MDNATAVVLIEGKYLDGFVEPTKYKLNFDSHWVDLLVEFFITINSDCKKKFMLALECNIHSRVGILLDKIITNHRMSDVVFDAAKYNYNISEFNPDKHKIIIVNFLYMDTEIIQQNTTTDKLPQLHRLLFGYKYTTKTGMHNIYTGNILITYANFNHCMFNLFKDNNDCRLIYNVKCIEINLPKDIIDKKDEMISAIVLDECQNEHTDDINVEALFCM